MGPLTLDPCSEVVMRDAAPLALGRRAVALLLRLVQQPGEVVTKDEMMAAGWHGLAVEESNLTTQVFQLRRVLKRESGGREWIETLPRRGYRFVGPAVWQERSPMAAAPAAVHSSDVSTAALPCVAVLPFAAHGGGDLAEFAHGLTEDLLSMLVSVRELAVISRASTQAAQMQLGSSLGSKSIADAAALGQALGARYLVSGAATRAGARLRVVVELADCASGLAVWSHAFDVSPDQVAAAPVPIAAQLVNTLAPQVARRELRRLRSRVVQDLTVHQLLQRARAMLASDERAQVDQAKPLLDGAVATDPECSEAHDLLAAWHSTQRALGWSTDPMADMRALEEHAQRAVALDPGNGPALARLGHHRALVDRDHELGRALLDRAIDATPNLPTVWSASSLLLSWIGDGAAAIRHVERARQLCPLDPQVHRRYAALALAHYVQGTYEQSLEWTLRSYAQHPRAETFLLFGAASAAALGWPDQARRFVALMREGFPNIRVERVVHFAPFREEARRHSWGEHLVAAGLPP